MGLVVVVGKSPSLAKGQSLIHYFVEIRMSQEAMAYGQDIHVSAFSVHSKGSLPALFHVSECVFHFVSVSVYFGTFAYAAVGDVFKPVIFEQVHYRHLFFFKLALIWNILPCAATTKVIVYAFRGNLVISLRNYLKKSRLCIGFFDFAHFYKYILPWQSIFNTHFHIILESYPYVGKKHFFYCKFQCFSLFHIVFLSRIIILYKYQYEYNTNPLCLIATACEFYGLVPVKNNSMLDLKNHAY